MTGLVRDGVCRRRQCATQAHMKPGLFEDLAYRGARPFLAWLELALGPGPVVVAGSVDHGDLQSTAATTPWQGSGGRDHAVINVMSSMARGGHRAACLAAALGVVLDHHGLQLVQLLAVRVVAIPSPGAVAAEVPAADLIAHAQAHQGLHVRDMPRVGEPDQGLHPAIEVAVHQVGAADEDDRVACAAEDEHPRVLQEPAQNRAYPDVLGQALHAGTQGADAPYPEVDLDSGARCPVQRIDHLIVNDRVQLEADVAAEAFSHVIDLTSE